MATSGERGTSRDPLELERALQGSADPDGFLPFDRFMEIALYAPGLGYYDRPASPIGVSGDFFTAPQLHPVFAATLGAHIVQRLTELPADGPLRVVELGPGNGELTEGIVREIARSPLADRGLDYLLVERSDARAHSALARARGALDGRGPLIRRTPSLGAEGPFEGVVVAHEFWDAQPARRFRSAAPGWDELGTRWQAGRFEEAARPLPPAEWPAGLPTDAEEGLVVEVAPQAEGSVRSVADHLVRGRAIFIDYGGEQSEILHTHRFGTLTAIRGHRVLPFPLEDPGEVDLSTYVNFSRIRAAAQRSGLRLVSDRTQAEVLVEWGLEEVKRRWEAAADAESALRLHLAVKNLLFGFPHFRALEFEGGRAEPR